MERAMKVYVLKGKSKVEVKDVPRQQKKIGPSIQKKRDKLFRGKDKKGCKSTSRRAWKSRDQGG